jgi:hypothetical protein
LGVELFKSVFWPVDVFGYAFIFVCITSFIVTDAALLQAACHHLIRALDQLSTLQKAM